MTRRHWAVVGMALLLALSAAAGALLTRDARHARATAVLRWGYYVTWDDSSYVSLQANINQLDVVSPYYYQLTPNGSIKSFVEPDRLAFMRASGVKIVPLIQNEAQWDEFRNNIDTAAKRQAIVDSLVDLVGSNGYDGINIDFEGVNAADQGLLTAFMTTLSGAFHARGWLVTQAVIARTSDQPSTWGGAYDYKALAQVNDYIVVMAYDYTGIGSKPGPIAPLWWVSNVVGYSEDRIPAEKLLLGIPLYGYDWNTKKGGAATAIDYPTAAALANRPGAKTGFSSDDGEPWIEYTDDAGDPHKVWYESADSFEKKIQVVIDNDLAGFAVWRVGHEDPSDWTIIAGLQTPATRLPPTENTPDRTYFPQTGHTLAYGFLQYWRDNGGLERFGYPLTEEFDERSETDGNTYTVQYFERGRFEYHPEYAGTPYAVLLGHVGRWALGQEGINPWATAVEGPYGGREFFAESGHTLGGVFKAYWESNGGLPTFGYPLSEEITEVNPDDGRTYVVQYFERARFEYHPEYAGTRYEVLLGLLGKAMLRERGWVR